jgi:hypothetical protein
MRHLEYLVIALGSDADVMKFLAMPGLPFVNLILMCHSVPEASRVALCKALKAKRPESPILMLCHGYDPTLAEVDSRMENLHSPEAFLDAIQLLISKPERQGLKSGSSISVTATNPEGGSPKHVAVVHAAGHSVRDMSRKPTHGPKTVAVRPNERKSESSRHSLPAERKPRGSGASPPALLPEVDLWVKTHRRKPCVTLLSSLS